MCDDGKSGNLCGSVNDEACYNLTKVLTMPKYEGFYRTRPEVLEELKLRLKIKWRWYKVLLYFTDPMESHIWIVYLYHDYIFSFHENRANPRTLYRNLLTDCCSNNLVEKKFKPWANIDNIVAKLWFPSHDSLFFLHWCFSRLPNGETFETINIRNLKCLHII